MAAECRAVVLWPQMSPKYVELQNCSVIHNDNLTHSATATHTIRLPTPPWPNITLHRVEYEWPENAANEAKIYLQLFLLIMPGSA